MSNLAPLSMLSAVAVLDNSLQGWTLLDVEGAGSRTYTFEVRFERPFSAAPLVHVGIVGLDVSKDDNLRIRVRSVAASAESFTIEARTWLHTRIWSVDVAWLAIGI